jgi:hypothetical protein
MQHRGAKEIDMAERERSERKAAWSGLGLILGAAVGVVLWQLTDILVLFPIVVGVGLLAALAMRPDRNRS